MTLADRIEALDGPSREIDAEIVKHLFPDAIIGPYCVGDDELVAFHAQPLIPNKTELPRFSDSVDAAIGLVPDDCRRKYSINVDGNYCEVIFFREGDGVVGKANHRHEPLAICAAALRAREAS